MTKNKISVFLLQAFVHISTAFANCNQETIKEEVYPSPVKADDVIYIARCFEDDVLDKFTPLSVLLYYFVTLILNILLIGKTKFFTVVYPNSIIETVQFLLIFKIKK